MADILLLAEHRFGALHTTTPELITAGRQIAEKKGEKLAIAIFGSSIKELADKLSSYAVDEVLLVDNPALKDYTPDGYAKALLQIIKERNPEAILTVQTYQGMDLMPKVATALNVGLAANCSSFEFKDEKIILTRLVYNTKLKQKIILKDKPLIITTENGAFAAAQPTAKKATITPVTVEFSPTDIRTKVKEVIETAKGSTDITKAKILVAAGRGIGKPENMQIIKDLAAALGADVAASRPVVDAGWAEKERQVGQSGKSVAPDLYIACGISGAMQHVAGMKKSKCIVAINKDPDAPIFGLAHYGIVGDLMEVIPAMIEEAKKL